MANPFLAEIKMFGSNFAPRGWALCDGQLLPIASNSALFSLLGTIYGGDGRTTFALPDMRGRSAVHPGHGPGLSSYRLGQRGGVETVTLNQTQIPSHTHAVTEVTSADQHIILSTEDAVNEIPETGDVPAVANFTDGIATKKVRSFGPPSASPNIVNGQTLSGSAGVQILNNGGSQYHTNLQPFLAVNYIIALQGVFPSRS